jgi:hypothetical protein
MRANVYTYYMPVPGLWSEESQRRLLDVWARSWRKQGWTPIVLNEGVAKKHPRYREFKQSYWNLPTEYGHDYEGACFMRYVAVAAMGGGMLVDYDVINYSFKPVQPDPKKFYCLDDRMNPKAMSTGACIGPASLYEGICQIFHTWKVSELDWNPAAKPPQYHVSDLTCMNQMFDGRKEKPAWLELRPGVGIFPDPTWKTAPLAHYCYAMHAAGYWPKHEWIEKIRPF